MIHRRRQPGRLVFCSALLAALPVWATDALLTADTSISVANAANNYGALPSVAVGNGSSALLRFDLSTLPAGSTAANIVQANLVLYASGVSTAGTVDAAVVNSAWSETGVTYTGAPSATAIAGAQAMVTQAGQYLVFDVT